MRMIRTAWRPPFASRCEAGGINEKELQFVIPALADKLGDGYYDLIRTPSGHSPIAFLPRLYKWLPIPLWAIRDEAYFVCPQCGDESFYTHRHGCICGWQSPDSGKSWRKTLELIALPFLILLRKAGYIYSCF